jgi:perosamine synthetase
VTVYEYNGIMCNYPIAPSLSPNTEPDDIRLALSLLFSPLQWKKGKSIGDVENWFRKYYQVETVYTFNSARSACYTLLNAFNITHGDEVIVQAFTCVAVPEVVKWVGATPVYADIAEDTYNIDPDDISLKITSRTKAIIVQHTFGIPADIRKIRTIADTHNLILIEDCAHSLGATVGNVKIGSFGDAAIFSFGRDKVVSGVFGGVAIIPDKSNVANKNIEMDKKAESSTFAKIYSTLQYPSVWWIAQQLLHPVLFSLILPMYNLFGLGKALLVVAQILHLSSMPVYRKEYKGIRPSVFPARMPNALASLAYKQLGKLYRYNVKRRLIAKKYGSTIAGAIYLRYPASVDSPHSLYYAAKKKGILLGNWYGNVIDPFGTDFDRLHYKMGSCPNAEHTARTILNLPTYPRMRSKDVERVLRVAKPFMHKE